MFKGLKSKLEDEAKRLQQYGENLANQVRSSASETGSDISGRGKRLFENALGAVQQTQQDQRVGTSNDDKLLVLNNDEIESDKTNIVNDETLISRQRHFSNASMESNESSFSALNLPPHVQQSPSLLETIASDLESNAGSVTDLNNLETISNDKFTSIFQRLQGKATDYKQRYRELVKSYRELDRENEKLRNVFSSTQDKALKRVSKLKDEKNELQKRINLLVQENEEKPAENLKIKKLQELLVKCKEEITANRERITALAEENDKLKKSENNHSTVVERVSAEWKGRFDRQEEEWIKRLAASEEKAVITIATSKAEMHSTLQQKDLELEKWISKTHSLEKQDQDANIHWQEKVDGLQKAIYALEQEKADMIQKLSQAKQEGVKLVKENEEKRHSDILTAELKKKDEDWGRRVKELEEQMQLAMEENDLQRKTSLADYDRVMGKLRERVEELEKENARSLLELRKREDELRVKEEQIQKFTSEQNEADNIQDSLAELDAKLTDERKRISGYEKKMRIMEEKISKMREENEKLMEELQNKKIGEKKIEESNIEQEITELHEKIIAMEESAAQAEINLKSADEELEKLRSIEVQLREKSDELKKIQNEFNEYKKLQGDNSEQEKEFEIKMAELTEKNEQFEKINIGQEKEIDNLNEQLLLMEENRMKLSNELKLTKEDMEKFLVIEDQLREKTDELKRIQNEFNEYKKLQNDNSEQEKEFEIKMTELTEKNEQLGQLNSGKEKEINDLRTKIIGLEESENKLTVEMKLANEELEKCRRIEVEIKEELKKIQNEYVKIKNEYSNQEEEFDRKMAEIAQKNEQLEQINAEQGKEIDSLHEKIISDEEAKTQISLELKSANQELKKFKQLEMQMNEKIDELERLKIEINRIEKLKDDSIKQEEQLKKQIQGNEEKQKKAIEAIQKEAEKAKQKAISGFQSEIRQLYNSINEKDCELATNHANITKLENELSNLRTETNQEKSTMDKQQLNKEQFYSSFGEQIDLDEILELKRKLADQEEELNRLKSMQERNGVQKAKRPILTPKMSITSDHLNFAEPTEAEYLRNVIYRYMTEREDLGRESVTLAKVICTVCKFPPEQLNNVLRREEARCQSWLPASVAEKASSTARRIHHYATSSGHNRLDYDKM